MDFLSKEIREGLEAARKRDLRKRSRLCVWVGDAVYPILRFWDDGFSLEAENAPHLRGLVDIFDGPRHLYQCLIIASVEENGEVICDFKRSTVAAETPPVDYWRGDNAPAGYLPRP